MKSDTIKHSKTSHKLSKTVRQGEKSSQVVGPGKNSFIPLYSDTKKNGKFLVEKNGKITKEFYAYKGYASSYNVNILNSFNTELQLKDTESAVRNKLN